MITTPGWFYGRRDADADALLPAKDKQHAMIHALDEGRSLGLEEMAVYLVGEIDGELDVIRMQIVQVEG